MAWVGMELLYKNPKHRPQRYTAKYQFNVAQKKKTEFYLCLPLRGKIIFKKKFIP